jgi:hypothetical protein
MYLDEAINKDLINVLKQIKTESGYETDLGNSVEQWVNYDVDAEVGEILSVNDDGFEPVASSVATSKFILSTYLIIAVQKSGNENTYAHLKKCERDVLKVLGANKDNFHNKYGAKFKVSKCERELDDFGRAVGVTRYHLTMEQFMDNYLQNGEFEEGF